MDTSVGRASWPYPGGSPGVARLGVHVVGKSISEAPFDGGGVGMSHEERNPRDLELS